MKALPHRYQVNGSGRQTGDVELTAERLVKLQSASPAEFDGPGNRWSPETLLVAAVADCLVLTFRAVAAASKLPWVSLDCDAIGTLDRVERAIQFTHIDLTARLLVPRGVDEDRARHALEKAERLCLVSRSLKASTSLNVIVEVEGPLADQPNATPEGHPAETTW